MSIARKIDKDNYSYKNGETSVSLSAPVKELTTGRQIDRCPFFCPIGGSEYTRKKIIGQLNLKTYLIHIIACISVNI